MTALTQEDLDRRVACDNPFCDCDGKRLTLRGRCHPRAGLRVVYASEDGVLEISCAQCGLLISTIEVALP